MYVCQFVFSLTDYNRIFEVGNINNRQYVMRGDLKSFACFLFFYNLSL